MQQVNVVNRRNQRRRNTIMRIIGIALVVVAFVILGIRFIENHRHPVAQTEYGWNLIVVNRDHYVPKDFSEDIVELSNGERIDARIYPELQAMMNAAREDGLNLQVASGMRTRAEQQQIFDEKVAAYQNEGASKREAQQLAKQWVAVPGTSEHELGIAVDINEDEGSMSEEIYNWLAAHAHEYGFIQRYPENKVDITHVSHEPWHYRYVGKEAAQAMNSTGMCLEEYVELIT